MIRVFCQIFVVFFFHMYMPFRSYWVSAAVYVSVLRSLFRLIIIILDLVD